MTEIIKACSSLPIEQAAFIPQAPSEVSSKLFNCAYAPQSIAPHGPAFEDGWQSCPSNGGRLQELPFGGPGGGKLQELPFGGGGFEKMPRGGAPYPMDIEFVGLEKCPVNKYLGYAKGGGIAEQIGKHLGYSNTSMVPGMSDGSRRAYSRVLK